MNDFEENADGFEVKQRASTIFFFRVARRIFIYTCVLILFANIVDISIYWVHKYDVRLTYGNLANILFVLVAVLLQKSGRINRKQASALIIYSTLLNIIYNTSVFFLIHHLDIPAVFYRNAFFISCGIPLVGFLINKYHSLVIGVYLCLYFLVFYFITDNTYMKDNFFITFTTSINFTIIVFLLIQSLERSIDDSRKSHEQLELRKLEIEEKNEQLISSISYAKRLQTAILPSDEEISTLFNDFFVFYRPRNIVSGDIFYLRKIERKLVLAVIDCTGHGVPGAMVSIIGHQALNRALEDFHLTWPAEILAKMNELVRKNLKRGYGDEVIDGMDMSLVTVDMSTMKLQYAGAFNPMYLVRNKELIEFKADRHSIGDDEDITTPKFTNHLIQLERGDKLYLFTDGYVDQFGGPKNKKYNYRRFKSKILEVCTNKMSAQRAAFQADFEEWKGPHDQIDDITLIGIHFDEQMFV